MNEEDNGARLQAFNMQLVARGLTLLEVAQALDMKPPAVRKRVYNGTHAPEIMLALIACEVLHLHKDARSHLAAMIEEANNDTKET